MKITLFGLTLSSSWGNGHATPYRAVLRALDRMGHRVVFYERDVEYYRWRRDFQQCEFAELVLYEDWAEVRTRALADVRESEVAVCASYCVEGVRIVDEVLEQAGPLHVFYDLDTPVTLKGLAKGDVEYLRRSQMREFDLYLSWTGGRNLEELEREWEVRRARPLYGCVDPELYRRTAPREEFRCDLSYMGTYAPDRQEKLDALLLEPSRRMRGARFVLAGSLYPAQWRWGENVRRFEHVAPAEHAAFYSSCRATLNITREEMARNGYCPSGRFFEAAACSTPVVSDWWEGLDTFFTPGEQIFVVESAEEVLEVLKSPQAELARMAERARQRTLEEHSGERRAQQLLEYLAEAREKTPTQANNRLGWGTRGERVREAAS